MTWINLRGLWNFVFQDSGGAIHGVIQLQTIISATSPIYGGKSMQFNTFRFPPFSVRKILWNSIKYSSALENIANHFELDGRINHSISIWPRNFLVESESKIWKNQHIPIPIYWHITVQGQYMNINVVELDHFLAVETIALEPPYPQHNNVPFNLNHEKRMTYFDKRRNCDFNANQLLQY